MFYFMVSHHTINSMGAAQPLVDGSAHHTEKCIQQASLTFVSLSEISFTQGQARSETAKWKHLGNNSSL